MMWFAFQGLIVCAVITANFFLQATPSGYVVGLAGVLPKARARHIQQRAGRALRKADRAKAWLEMNAEQVGESASWVPRRLAAWSGDRLGLSLQLAVSRQAQACEEQTKGDSPQRAVANGETE